MTDNPDDRVFQDAPAPVIARRTILRAIAGAPLIATFGLSASPFMRFLKPTTQPTNLFQGADFPTVVQPARFSISDFPEVWNALPFLLPMKYLVFNAQKSEVRSIPAFIIRTGENTFVAFNRLCPLNRSHVLNYVLPMAGKSCGCNDEYCAGYCIGYVKSARLVCPCDGSSYNVADKGRQLCQAQYPSLRELAVARDGDWLNVVGFVQQGIA